MHPSCLPSCPRAFSRLPVSLAPRGGQVSTGSEHRVPTEGSPQRGPHRGATTTVSTRRAPGSPPPPDPVLAAHTRHRSEPARLPHRTCRLLQEPSGGKCCPGPAPDGSPGRGIHSPCLQVSFQDVPAAVWSCHIPPCTGLTPTSSCIYLVLVPRGSAAPGNRLVLLALIPKVWLRAQPPQHKSRKVETERRGLASGRTSRALDSSWLLGSWEAPGAAASPALKAAGLWGSGPQALPCSTSQQSGCDGQINSFSKQGS